MRLNSIKVGDKASITNIVKENDIKIFSMLSGDKNPIHLDETFAERTIFKQRIAPGMLISSYISAVIANILPGEGSIYLEQTLKFIKPVYIGDIITSEVEVIDIKKKLLL